jgi:hypothetical protein
MVKEEITRRIRPGMLCSLDYSEVYSLLIDEPSTALCLVLEEPTPAPRGLSQEFGRTTIYTHLHGVRGVSTTTLTPLEGQ